MKKYRTYKLIPIFVLLFLFLGTASMVSAIEEPEPASDPLNIVIIGNEDFVNRADDHGWLGNGTEADPYIIRDLVIELTKVN